MKGEGYVADSMVCAGAIVRGGMVRRSVLSRGVVIHPGAEVEGSVLLHGVQVGPDAVVRNVIVDKNVTIPEGAAIGVDPDVDRARFVVSPGRRRDREGSEGRVAERISTDHPGAAVVPRTTRLGATTR